MNPVENTIYGTVIFAALAGLIYFTGPITLDSIPYLWFGMVVSNVIVGVIDG